MVRESARNFPRSPRLTAGLGETTITSVILQIRPGVDEHLKSQGMVEERRLLLVGVGETGRPYLRIAHARGVAVTVVEKAPRLDALRTAGLLGPADRGYAVWGSDDASWFGPARAAATDTRIDGVVAFSERHVVAAAMVADELGLRGSGLRAAIVSRNKALQRHAFDRTGLLQPQFVLVETVDDAAAWAKERYPVVAKPLNGTGSSGVRVIAEERDLRAWASAARPLAPFLVEEFLSGPERSCEAIVSDGEVVFANLTEKETTLPPACVEIAHTVPAPDPSDIVAGAYEAACKVARALAMRNGIMHLEMKLEPSGPHMIEVAVRTPGDFIMDLVELATGVDLYGAVVDVALGSEVDVRPFRQRAAAAWFPCPPEGTIVGIGGFESVPTLPGVVHHSVRVRVGDRVRPLLSSRDRVGAVVVQAPDRTMLAARLEAVKRMLRIDIAVDDARQAAPHGGDSELAGVMTRGFVSP
jgi:biotin carboxylase